MSTLIIRERLKVVLDFTQLLENRLVLSFDKNESSQLLFLLADFYDSGICG